MRTEMEKETTYEVGHGKPPKETRFKPGQSGNPRGRPKGPSLNEIMARIANQSVDRDWARSHAFGPGLSNLEGVVARLFKNARQGDGAAIKLVLDLARRMEDSVPPDGEDARTMEDG